MTLEICVDSYKSALIADATGADRLELCQDLAVGGLTPTPGFLKIVKKVVRVPVFTLIRPRAGNFVFEHFEIDQMIYDIEALRDAGADGLVFGALNNDFSVDLEVCKKLLDAACGLPVTFHRAFDVIEDKRAALEELVSLGFKRVLTAGGTHNAITGAEKLKDLVLQASSRIIVMPGGDITENNILNILKISRAREVHSSARPYDPDQTLEKMKFCCGVKISKMKKCFSTTGQDNME